MQTIEVEVDSITSLTKELLMSAGINSTDASITAMSIIEAEKRGVSSHGLTRLKSYVERISQKLINKHPKTSIVKNLGSILILDGDNGLGQVVADQTLEYCFNNLKKESLVIASVSNSNHFGTCGYYSRQAALNGYLAITATNAGPTMAPWGGIDPMLGTNPFAISFPAKEYGDFTLDIATSAVAKGKIRTYANENENIPLGWAIDKKGNHTTDSSEALEGTVLPFGKHKGYGLSMVVDALCAGLSMASLSYETESLTKNNSNANIGHFFMFVKIQDFLELDDFSERMENWFNNLKKSAQSPDFDEIIIPGELENKKSKLNNKKININSKTYLDLCTLSRELGVSLDDFLKGG